MRKLNFFIACLMCCVPFLQAQLHSGGESKHRSMASEHTGYVPVEKDEHCLQYQSDGLLVRFDAGGIMSVSATHVLGVRFVGSRNVTPTGKGVDIPHQAGRPTQTMQLHALKEVCYKGLWQDIDLRIKSSAKGVYESCYKLFPDKYGKVHNELIRLRYNRALSMDASGNLAISYPTGTALESAPVAWQTVQGRRHPVAVSFRLYGNHELGYNLGTYIPGIAVEIDPTLVWNTFLGGGGSITSTKVDVSGNVYVCGNSGGWGTPIRAFSAGNDGFVAKFNSSGSRVWNTFLGGSGADFAYGIKLDNSGNVYVCGYSDATWGTPLRAFSGGTNDGFVVKLNSSGVMQWNTFLGGANTDTLFGVVVDVSGNIYVCGYSSGSWGTPIRAFSGTFAILVAKLNSSGSLLWNTFLDGGIANDITLDNSGNVYICGYSLATWGSPVRAFGGGYQDGVVVKLTSAGVLVWNTFLGGSATDDLKSICIDNNENIYVGGLSEGTWGSPIRAFQGSMMGSVAKLTSSGMLVWNTFLGGGNDNINGVALDGAGNLYATGLFNTTWGTPVWPYTGNGDIGVVKLNSSGTVMWNGFLGINSSRQIPYSIAVDNINNLYIGGYSDWTWGTPLQPPYYSADANLVKISDATGILFKMIP